VPHILSLHKLLLFYIQHWRCKATSSADTADSCYCNGCSLSSSNWPNLPCYSSPLSVCRISSKISL